MRKSRSKSDILCTGDRTDTDEGPRRIPGAIVTSWNGAREIDLDALFERSTSGPTVSGAANAAANRPADGIVALRDGSPITFVGPNRFESVLTT
jgi:hypothetical protein